MAIEKKHFEMPQIRSNPHLGLVQMTSVDLVHIRHLASGPTSREESLLLGLHGRVIIDREQRTATFRQVLHHDLPKAVVRVPGVPQGIQVLFATIGDKYVQWWESRCSKWRCVLHAKKRNTYYNISKSMIVSSHIRVCVKDNHHPQKELGISVKFA